MLYTMPYDSLVGKLLCEIPYGEVTIYSSLTGYAGGVDKMLRLLQLEGVDKIKNRR